MLSTIQAKLLIVDDLPENLLALEALIKREDRQVFKALSADEALSLRRREVGGKGAGDRERQAEQQCFQ